ncbi:MAG: hypothetical protein LUG18_09845 [Candidatus Azobacteroides sp.]|nr:hypothetical protein [Candidatus Azobacteroides sp.]
MESLFFKHIFSVFLRMLAEGKRVHVYDSCQLNVCLFIPYIRKGQQEVTSVSIPFSFLSATFRYRGKASGYPLASFFRSRIHDRMLYLFALPPAIPWLFKENKHRIT